VRGVGSPWISWAAHHSHGEYIELDGWSEDITEARTPSDLPQSARDYLDFIAEQIEVPIVLVGVGPGREQIIWSSSARRRARSASTARSANASGSASSRRT